MMHTIRYGSTDDLASQYTVTLIPTAETDAILIIPPDKLPTSVAEVGGNTQGTLYIAYNQGSANQTIIRMYDAYKGLPASAADWYQEVIESDTAGVATLYPFTIVLTASANVAWQFPIGAMQAMKFTVQASGTVTNSVLTLTAALRSN